MTLGDEGKPREAECPTADEEAHGEAQNGSGGDMLRTEKEEPIATVWSRQEEVLQEDSDKEPQGDLSLRYRPEQRRDLVRHLTVVRGQSEEKCDTNGPQTKCYDKRHWEKNWEST